MKKVREWLILAAASIGLVSLSSANQAPLFSPTISPVSGLQLTNNYNSAIDAINTCNSGNTAPVNQLALAPSAGNCWLDTSLTPYKWKIYDGTQWTTVAFLDQVNHYWTPVVGGGPINSIASAATTDLCNATNGQPAYVSITGVVSITSFGSNCTTGQVKFGVFTGILTLTHNAASLILPFNGSNITTAAGDTFSATYLGGGNWRVTSYQKASGAPSIPAPTVQSFTAGTALTYTPAAGMVRIRVRMVAGGGGGGSEITGGGGGPGTNGNNSIFESWTVVGGTGGTTGTTSQLGGIGGTGGANGTGVVIFRQNGGRGGSASTGAGADASYGGGTVFGPGGPRGLDTGAGQAGATNSGGGGSGGNVTATAAGGGGGGGEYVEFWMTAAQVGAGVTYTVGATAAGGPAGGQTGGAGAAGRIIVEEFYS